MYQSHQYSLAGDRTVLRSISDVPYPKDNQLLIETRRVGICASDVALYEGRYSAPHQTPVCFGHEWSGVVLEAGPEVCHIRPGDYVTGECSLWCGACDRCQTNRNLCRSIKKFGITTDGAARSYFLIAEPYLHLASPDLDLSLLALAEPLAVAAKGIVAAKIPDLTKARILILGAGMIGLSCLILLRHLYRASAVFLSDPDQNRADYAQRLGAEPYLEDWSKPAIDGGYAGLYNRDGFDLIIETSGAPDAFCQAIRLANPGGSLVMFGFAPRLEFPARDIVTKGLRLAGTIGGSGCFEIIVPWLEDHSRLALSLISCVIEAGDADHAFRAALKRPMAPKVMLRFEP